MPPIMGAAALWIAFLFSGLLAQERSFSAEQQNGCMDGLLLAPIDPDTVYVPGSVIETSSPAPGTCAGLQFDAVFQLPPAALLQLMAVA